MVNEPICPRGENVIEPVNVYVYGVIEHLDATGQYPITTDAVYYKNNIPTQLNNSKMAAGIYSFGGLALSGDTVYTGLSYRRDYLPVDEGGQVFYWINGAISNLQVTNQLLIPQIEGVALNGGNFYILYSGQTVSGTAFISGLALNGVTQYSNNDYLVGIIGSGTDIYIYGTSSQNNNAIYYKNDQSVQFQNVANGSSVTGMFVSGQDVYACGLSAGQPVYWKNGQLNTLTHNNAYAYPTGIAVKGTDVYIAGYIRAGKALPGDVNGSFINDAVLWKNGAITTLGSSLTYNFYTSNIVISGNDVYVGGRSGPDSALTVYWKNGMAVTMKSSLSGSFFPDGIVVTPK